MPSIAQLNVEIGARIGNLQKGLRDAERELRSGGKRLASVGNELSQTFSLALGGIITGSITAAGEMESLRLAMESTFQNAGRSIEQARGHMEDLRKAALAPGLDFPQAVKASISLQGVGGSAEDALKTIKGLANAISLTGGTAANLESVTVQMSQMISKGKVLAQDLRIIQENMPIVSKLMKQAFGTSNAEDLQKLGITGEEFVRKITAEMEKLPKVQGGITNAIVNFWSALKQAAADFGEEINRVFNIGQKAEQFSAYLSEFVSWFKSLDDSTKKLIVSTTLYVAAAGPVLKILGSIRLAGAQAVSTFNSIVGVSKDAIGGFLSMAKALGSVRAAIAVIGGGVALAAITAIAGAVYLFSQNTDAAAVAAKEFNKAQAETTRLYAEQTAELNKNFDTLRNTNATTAERKAAIDSLKAAYPDYLKNINLEIASNEKLTEIQSKLSNEILRSVAERQKAIAVTAIYEKQAQLLLRIQQLRDGAKVTPGEATQVDTGDLIRTGSVAAAVMEELQKQADGLKTEAKLVGDQFDRTFNIVAAPRRFTPLHDLETTTKQTDETTKNLSKTTDDHKKKVKEAEVEYDGATRRVKQWADAMLNLKEVQDLYNTAKPLKPLESGGGQGKTQFGVALNEVESLTAADNRLKSIGTALARAKAGADEWSASMVQLGSQIKVLAEGPLSGMNEVISAISSQSSNIGKVALAGFVGLSEAAAEGKASFAELGKAALAGAAQVAKSLIIEIALKQALKAVEKGGILGALASIGIAAASVGALSALVSSVKTPKLAQGGIAYGPTSAIVGEYPGARANPEVIAPLSKLKSIIGGARAANQHVTVGGAVRWNGQDFVIAFEQAQKNVRRTRGY